MIVLVGQTKGGVGKSMIAANLAAMAASKGRTVLLVDADRQATSVKWASVRLSENVQPDVQALPVVIDTSLPPAQRLSKFKERVLTLADRFDEVIIDCGGHDSNELRGALMVADLLIVPCRPTQSDLWGLDDLNKIVADCLTHRPQLRSTVVLNLAASLNFYNATGEAAEAVSETVMDFSGCVIVNREVYNNAYKSGMGAIDLDPGRESTGKAVADIQALYSAVYEEVSA